MKDLEIVERALQGDRSAVETLIKEVENLIYNLSVRFFWNPEDAKDATQEILIKVVTNLAKFHGKSSFKTWTYRIATNYLLNAKRSEAEYLTFKEGAEHLERGLSYPNYQGADERLLEKEVKISCTTSMLVCLSRPLRLAYLIGEILQFDSNEGSYILDIDASAFRKRLSNGRKKIRGFMANQCGIYDPANLCRCKQQITYSIEADWFDPKQLNFADKGINLEDTVEEVDRMIDDVAYLPQSPSIQKS